MITNKTQTMFDKNSKAIPLNRFDFKLAPTAELHRNKRFSKLLLTDFPLIETNRLTSVDSSHLSDKIFDDKVS